jgi:hypothetical protein
MTLFLRGTNAIQPFIMLLPSGTVPGGTVPDDLYAVRRNGTTLFSLGSASGPSP